MGTLEKYFKVTAQQEYEKNPKLSAEDVEELLKWSDENINLHGKLVGEYIICTYMIGLYILFCLRK